MPYKYFSMEQDKRLFVCSETGETGISPGFVHALDDLRERCGFPFVINSGYRSRKHSKERSKQNPGEHTRGAADIKITDGVHRRLLVKKAIEHGFTGIGVDKNFVHVDKRTTDSVLWVY